VDAAGHRPSGWGVSHKRGPTNTSPTRRRLLGGAVGGRGETSAGRGRHGARPPRAGPDGAAETDGAGPRALGDPPPGRRFQAGPSAPGTRGGRRPGRGGACRRGSGWWAAGGRAAAGRGRPAGRRSRPHVAALLLALGHRRRRPWRWAATSAARAKGHADPEDLVEDPVSRCSKGGARSEGQIPSPPCGRRTIALAGSDRIHRCVKFLKPAKARARGQGRGRLGLFSLSRLVTRGGPWRRCSWVLAGPTGGSRSPRARRSPNLSPSLANARGERR